MPLSYLRKEKHQYDNFAFIQKLQAHSQVHLPEHPILSSSHHDLWWIVSHFTLLCKSHTYQATCLSPDWNYSGGLHSLNPFLHHKNEGSAEAAATVKVAEGVVGSPSTVFSKAVSLPAHLQLLDCQTAINVCQGRRSIILTSFKQHELYKRSIFLC